MEPFLWQSGCFIGNKKLYYGGNERGACHEEITMMLPARLCDRECLTLKYRIMKRLYFTVFSLAFVSLVACSNSHSQAEPVKEPVAVAGAPATNISTRYKLYPTENMWIFIKLDTSNGRMWLVQYSVEGDESRFETVLNSVELDTSQVNGRYELYPTKNMYNFILLDTFRGATYQVQWSIDPKDRLVVPIL